MTVRPALYARAATGEQDSEAQVAALRAYADRQGREVSLVFRGVVTGSGHKPRQEFERFREAVRSRSVEVVLVVKLDRIARFVREALAFCDEAEANGIRVIVATQEIDTRTPAGRLTRTILAGVVESEGELIRERTRAAMAAIKAGTKPTRSGRPPGRPRRVIPEAVATAREPWRMSRSWAEIAQAVCLKAETIRRAVWAAKQPPVPVGNTSSGETVAPSGGDHAGGQPS